MSMPGAPLKRLLGYLVANDTGVRRRDGFSISTLGICLAKQLFAMTGYPATTKRAPRMMLLWRLGMLIEREVIALLQMAGETILGLQKEYVGANPPREGHIDGLILRDGKLYAFDVKSANSQSFRKWVQSAGLSPWQAMKNGWVAFDPRTIAVKSYRPVREIYPAYYFQAQGYLELIHTRKEYQEYLIEALATVSEELAAAAQDGSVPVATDGFYFFVYCKDDSSLYEEFVPYDGEEIDARIAHVEAGRFDALEAAEGGPSDELTSRIRKYREFTLADDGTLPWQCKRCDFTKICWGKVKSSSQKDEEAVD